MGAVSTVTRILLPLGLAAATLPACNSGASTTPITVDADFVSCSTETRATPYQPGMLVTSDAGAFVVKLLLNTFTDADGKVLEEAPAQGLDVWTIETDAAATMTPVDGLTISVKPYMPDHIHGTTPAGVTPAGAGTYTISPLNLYMAGYWTITLTITDSSGASPVADTAVFKICVPS